MKRQCVLDTETTGLNAKNGDKIVEIGVVEMIDNVRTGRVFHTYINPQRKIPADSTEIHGITDDMVKNSPLFKDVADDFVKFIEGSELIIHNLVFDVKFLNEELSRASKNKVLSYIANGRCSLELSRTLFPKPKKKKNETPEEESYRKLGHSLDEMCDRLIIDRSHRTSHGALLDAELLADMFIALNKKFPLDELEDEVEQRSWVRSDVKMFEGVTLPRATINEADLAAHKGAVKLLEEENKVVAIFNADKTHLPTKP